MLADQTDIPAKPVLGEVGAAAKVSAFAGGMATDGHLSMTPEGARPLLRHHQIASAFAQRRRAVTSVEWGVEPGGDGPADKAAADDLRAQLEALRWDAVTDKMLHGLFFGFAAAEAIYAMDGARVRLADIRVRKAERFLWKGHECRLKTEGKADGEELAPAKWWLFRAPSDNDDDPYGPGLAWPLWWLDYFSRNAARLWGLALEKWSDPTVLGTYPQGTSETEIDELLEALLKVRGNAAVAVPESAKVSLLEAMRASGGNYDKFMEFLDSAISKVILGQTMTTDEGSSLSQARVHADVKVELVRGDADLLCESFNVTVAAWLTAWNFPGAVPPRVWRRLPDAEDLNARAARDEIVGRMSGLRPTAEHVVEIYGGKWERSQGQPADSGNPGNRETKTVALADPVTGAGRDALDDLAGQAAGALAPEIAAWIAAAEAELAAAGSLEDFRERLAQVAATAGVDKAAEVLGAVMTLADLQGRAEALDGPDPQG
ncbi:MAG: DUF935 domain-containing protein [Magnetospirillum sp. WYHS-4]